LKVTFNVLPERNMIGLVPSAMRTWSIFRAKAAAGTRPRDLRSSVALEIVIPLAVASIASCVIGVVVTATLLRRVQSNHSKRMAKLGLN